MTKGLKYGALSIVASALLTTNAFAGAIYSSYDGTDYAAYAAIVKASELSGKLTDQAVPAALLGVYVPSDIDLTTLSNPTFNYVLSNAKWTLDTATYDYFIVELAGATIAATDKVVAQYTTGSGTSTIAFGATGPQVSNNARYVVVEATAGNLLTNFGASQIDGTVTVADVSDDGVSATGVALAANALFTETTAGNQTLTVKLGQGDSQNISDIATGTFLSAERQLCASVTEKFNATIDPNDGFKSFAAAAATDCGVGTAGTTDSVEVTIKAEDRDIDAVDTTDTAVVQINVTPALPAGTVISAATYTLVETAAVADISADCSINTAGTLVTCTVDSTVDLATGLAAGGDSNGDTNHDLQGAVAITLDVPGTVVMSRTTFTADVDYDFTNTLATDYLESANNALLLASDAGVWAYNGTTLTAPSINSNADTNQMVKLNNDSTTDANVFWTLTDDAGNTVSLIEVASANGGAATLAAGTSATWLASDLRAAAQAVNASFGEKFRGSALVTTTGTVSGVTVMMINGGRDRVLPLD